MAAIAGVVGSARDRRHSGPIKREASSEEQNEIRELWKRHSIAEDERDLPGLISTLTPGLRLRARAERHRWEGHEGATRFYMELLSAFPDIHFDLTDIVIGPQGVCEEADVTGTHQAEWLGFPPTGEQLDLEGRDLLPLGSRSSACSAARRSTRPGYRSPSSSSLATTS